jgi:hypothetical protein
MNWHCSFTAPEMNSSTADSDAPGTTSYNSQSLASTASKRSIGQSVLVSSSKWDPRPDFYYCQLRVYWRGVPSLTRGRVSNLQLLLVLDSAAILRSESGGTYDHILLSDLRFLQPGGPGSHIYIPQWQLCLQAMGSRFAVSYYSQGYSGNIRTCLHTGGLMIRSVGRSVGRLNCYWSSPL